VDSGYYEGAEVPIYYDPLVMKVVCWGSTREEARRRLIAALEETVVEGVKTNLAFLHLIRNDPAFASGDYSTRIVEERRLAEKAVSYSHRRLRLPRRRAEKRPAAPGVDAWRVASRMGL